MKNSHRVLPLRKFFLYGLFAGIIATVATYLGTGILGLPYPPEAIFQTLIAPVPGSIQSVVVETFQEYAKYSAFTVSAAIYAVIFALVAVLVGFLYRKDFVDKIPQALALGTVITTAIAIGLDTQEAVSATALQSTLELAMLVVLVVLVNLAYSAIFVYQVRADVLGALPQARLGSTSKESASPRRGFLRKVIVAAAALVVVGVAAKIGLAFLTGQPVVTSNEPIPTNSQPYQVGQNLPAIFNDPRIRGLVDSEVTDNRIFYRVDIDAIVPQLDFDQWTLKISGKVNNPMTLDRAALLSLPTQDEFATLECVSNTIDPPGALISTAKWTGISLASLLKQAAPTPDAAFVVFKCADGYTVGIQLDRAMKPASLLAYKMNDDFLPNEHGSPLRAIVPGIYGMMNAKWITEIDLTDQVYLGYWQERGWSNDARIRTTSIIYHPSPQAPLGTLPIAGIAFAGDRGISKVEVSTDGGATWNEATLKPPRSPYSWVLWAYEWTPTAKGTHRLTVRATDGTGQLQDRTFNPPFPDGATGYHTVDVTVS